MVAYMQSFSNPWRIMTHFTADQLHAIATAYVLDIYGAIEPYASFARDISEIDFIDLDAEKNEFDERLGALAISVDDILSLHERLNGPSAPPDQPLANQDDDDDDGPSHVYTDLSTCCTKVLRDAKTSYDAGDVQIALLHLGFVEGCLDAFNNMESQHESERDRALTAAWSYLPYISYILEEREEDSDDDDGGQPDDCDWAEEQILDAVFVLGIVQGLLWFSKLYTPDELTSQLNPSSEQ